MSGEVLYLKKRKPKNPYAEVPGVPYLKLNTESGIYYVRKYRAGKGALFESTKEKLKSRAKTVAENMIAEWLGDTRKITRRRTIGAICEELEPVLKQEFENGDRRLKTWDHDQTYLPITQDLFGDTFADEIDEEWFDDWVRTKGRRMNRTLFDIAKYLSKVLTFAHRRKYISRKPVIKNPDKASKKGRILTDEEVRAILDHADETLLLQIVLGYECGMRTGEVRGLRWDMLQQDAEAVVVVLPEWFVKANARSIQLSPLAGKLITERRIKTEGRGSPFVFPAPKSPMTKYESAKVQNKRWRDAVEAAKLTGKVWFYHLRHTFYNRTLLELGLPVQQVSEYGGTSIRTLQKAYLKGDAKRTSVVSKAIQLPVREKFVKGECNGGESG